MLPQCGIFIKILRYKGKKKKKRKFNNIPINSSLMWDFFLKHYTNNKKKETINVREFASDVRKKYNKVQFLEM